MQPLLTLISSSQLPKTPLDSLPALIEKLPRIQLLHLTLHIIKLLQICTITKDIEIDKFKIM